jgi:hypothetical protein
MPPIIAALWWKWSFRLWKGLWVVIHSCTAA